MLPNELIILELFQVMFLVLPTGLSMRSLELSKISLMQQAMM